MIRRSITKAARLAHSRTLLITLLTIVSGCGGQPVPRAAPAQSDPVANEPVTTDPKSPRDVTFEELNIDLKPDSVFESWMLPLRIEELAGKRIRLRGFMCAAIFQLHNIREFPLMREKECPYGPGGQAHHVAEVVLKPGTTTTFSAEEVCIEGIFQVKPYLGPNGKTWSLYRLEDAALCR